MLKYYIKAREAVESLRTNQDGVVSFEYVLVAACVVFAVAATFGTAAGGNIQDKLKSAIDLVLAKLPTS
jgi:Flp pilus assembly pilin Flp